jgi:hypothetical protein
VCVPNETQRKGKRWLNIIGYGKIRALGMLVETSEGLTPSIIGNVPSVEKGQQAQVVILREKDVGAKVKSTSTSWVRLILFVTDRSAQ